MEQWSKVDWLDLDFDLEVSTLGRVRRSAIWYDTVSKAGNPCRSNKKARIYSQWVAKNGYKHIAIKRAGTRRKYLVHRLVAQAFVAGYEPSLSVNHIDGNKLNNTPSNLEWVTLSRNTQLQWRDGLINLHGENHPSSKLTPTEVRQIRHLLSIGEKKSHIAKAMGISHNMVLKIERGQAWKHID